MQTGRGGLSPRAAETSHRRGPMIDARVEATVLELGSEDRYGLCEGTTNPRKGGVMFRWIAQFWLLAASAACTGRRVPDPHVAAGSNLRRGARVWMSPGDVFS